jgi:hypothetical protein
MEDVRMIRLSFLLALLLGCSLHASASAPDEAATTSKPDATVNRNDRRTNYMQAPKRRMFNGNPNQGAIGLKPPDVPIPDLNVPITAFSTGTRIKGPLIGFGADDGR